MKKMIKDMTNVNINMYKMVSDSVLSIVKDEKTADILKSIREVNIETATIMAGIADEYFNKMKKINN